MPVQIEFFGDPRLAKDRGALASEPARAVIKGSEKLIQYIDRQELYRLDKDPGEGRNLVRVEPQLAEMLARHLPPPSAGLIPRRGRQEGLNFQQEQALRALGYLE